MSQVSNVRIAKGEQTRQNKKRIPAAVIEQSKTGQPSGRKGAAKTAIVSSEASVIEQSTNKHATAARKRGRPKKERPDIDFDTKSETSLSTRMKKRGRGTFRKRGVRFDIDQESAGSDSSSSSSDESDVTSVNSEIYSDFCSVISEDVDDKSECPSEVSEASYKSVDEPPKAISKRLRELYWGKIGALCWVKLPRKDWENCDDEEDDEEEKLCKVIGVSEFDTSDDVR